MEHARVHAKVFGRVQGVNYRWMTSKEASRHGLTGWVRNLPDGNVELIAEGRPEDLNALIEWCREGPPLAVVRDIDLHWEEASGEFDQFNIRY